MDQIIFSPTSSSHRSKIDIFLFKNPKPSSKLLVGNTITKELLSILLSVRLDVEDEATSSLAIDILSQSCVELMDDKAMILFFSQQMFNVFLDE